MAQYKINIKLLVVIIVLIGISYIALSISIFNTESIYNKADKSFNILISQKTQNNERANSTDYCNFNSQELTSMYQQRLLLCQTQLQRDAQHSLIFIIGISLASLVVGVLIGLLIILIKFGGLY